ncbi:MAG: hypothetical protein CL613_01790 [Aquimarina sp.]|nr:hypothetical protein [Aquimarina sp.]
MDIVTDKMYEELKDILEKNVDAVKGYRKAAEHTDHPGLKSYFEKKSIERSEFNAQLRDQVIATYPDFHEGGGSTKGSLHRAWMDLKSLFSANDPDTMLAESIKGDKAAIKEYDDLIQNKQLSPHLRNLLLTQRTKIQDDIRQNDSLENM